MGDFCFSLCFFALEVYTSHVLGLLMPFAVLALLLARSSAKTEVFYSTFGQVGRQAQVECRNDGNELPAAKSTLGRISLHANCLH